MLSLFDKFVPYLEERCVLLSYFKEIRCPTNVNKESDKSRPCTKEISWSLVHLEKQLFTWCTMFVRNRQSQVAFNIIPNVIGLEEGIFLIKFQLFSSHVTVGQYNSIMSIPYNKNVAPATKREVANVPPQFSLAPVSAHYHYPRPALNRKPIHSDEKIPSFVNNLLLQLRRHNRRSFSNCRHSVCVCQRHSHSAKADRRTCPTRLAWIFFLRVLSSLPAA